ncbi:hypothetical protein AAC387_Pa11g1171 [Persea americana]
MELCSFLRPAAVVLSLVLVQLLEAQALNQNRTRVVPALLVFGDSLVDPGNNNVLPTVARSNFPPYGRDFLGHKATGRFSNGKIATDVIVSELGIKEYLPAYLDPELKPQDLLTGVSFGSAGTGYDTLTATTFSVLSIWDQLELFKEYKEKLKAIAGEGRAAHIISESLYIVCAGSNDVVLTYFSPTSPYRKMQYDFSSYASFLVQTASSFLEELYHLGARRIGVLGLPPLGCLPSQRTMAGGQQRECVASFNEASKEYNYKLNKELKMLGAKLPGTKMVYIDFYTPAYEIFQDPTKYGFEQASTGCCGTGVFEYAILCNDLSPHTCTDASKYVFFDSYHPTQRVYEIFLPKVLQEYLPHLI